MEAGGFVALDYVAVARSGVDSGGGSGVASKRRLRLYSSRDMGEFKRCGRWAVGENESLFRVAHGWGRPCLHIRRELRGALDRKQSQSSVGLAPT